MSRRGKALPMKICIIQQGEASICGTDTGLRPVKKHEPPRNHESHHAITKHGFSDADASGKTEVTQRLVFVYNADSGLFNTVTGIAHKILSPLTYACQLCSLTHGYFRVRREWEAFLEDLDIECRFLHRDEFQTKYGKGRIDPPAIYVEQNGALDPWANRKDIEACPNLDALKTLIRSRLDPG